MPEPMKYRPHRFPWSAEKLFAGTDFDQLSLDAGQREWLKEFFWYDLCAEYDSTNLYRHILAHRRSFSLDFLAFSRVWYWDERNHADGFRLIYQRIFKEPPGEIDEKLSARKADFSHLEPFFSDEFKLSVLFAYDEMATVMTYKKDTFYRNFGAPEFLTWIKRVRTDEAIHFSNIVKLLRTRHRARLHEVPDCLEQIAEIEKRQLPYQNTFLFDHECPHFLLSPDELAGECMDTTLKVLTNQIAAGAGPMPTTDCGHGERLCKL